MKNVLLFLLFLSIGAITLNAQDGQQKISLDGKSVTYAYPELGTVRLDFSEGFVQFNWLNGPNAGDKGQGFPYQVKKVGEKAYFLKWTGKKDASSPTSMVTVFLNLNAGEVHASALINPGTDAELILWDSATIIDTNIE